MELTEALAERKEAILSVWIERTLDSYSSADFFKKSKDPFSNPVGSNIAAGLRSLYALFLNEAPLDDFIKPLDQVVRIRAVQDFAPSQAVVPFLELKWIIRQIFSKEKACQPLLGQLDQLDCTIEKVALMAFDMYMQCREQLYQNRIRELKSGSAVLTDAACPSSLIKRRGGLPVM